MLDLSDDFAARLRMRSWFLGETEGSDFVTSDHPLVSINPINQGQYWIGMGLDAAENIFFPIDLRHVLILSRQRMPDQRVTVRRSMVELINAAVAAYCYRFVYSHPATPGVDRLVPGMERDIAPQAELDAMLGPIVEGQLMQLRAETTGSEDDE